MEVQGHNSQKIGENNPIHIEAIDARRSIRKFQEKPVQRQVLKQILNAARVAPSAKNRQPWKFLVFGGKKKSEVLSAMEMGLHREQAGNPLLPDSKYGLPDAWNTLRIMREAPIIILVLNTHAKSPFKPVNEEERISEIVDSLSIGAAMEHILLRATDMGLGTLWIANTFFAYTELTAFLSTNFQLVGAIALGYAAEAPAARPRKPLEEIVEYYI